MRRRRVQRRQHHRAGGGGGARGRGEGDGGAAPQLHPGQPRQVPGPHQVRPLRPGVLTAGSFLFPVIELFFHLLKSLVQCTILPASLRIFSPALANCCLFVPTKKKKNTCNYNLF